MTMPQRHSPGGSMRDLLTGEAALLQALAAIWDGPVIVPLSKFLAKELDS